MRYEHLRDGDDAFLLERTDQRQFINVIIFQFIFFLFGLEKLLCRFSFEELPSYEALLENRTLEIRAEIVTIQKGIGNVSKLNQIFWSPHGFWIRSIRSTPHKNEK